MSKVIIGESISHEMTLWRYMSLDKLIDLLKTQELYFSPLSSYEKTDPFEGLLPKAMQRDISATVHCNLIMSTLDRIKYSLEHDTTEEQKIKADIFMDIHKDGSVVKKDIDDLFIKKLKSPLINCWHSNQYESEAMWKLYSYMNNGIAIKTSTTKLSNSIILKDLEHNINIGRVKYIDYDDINIPLTECDVDGFDSPLLKRISYSHEHEVRAFISTSLNYDNAATYTPTAKRVHIDLDTLIENIYITPYASEPYPSSVKYICQLLGVPSEKIVESKLMSFDSSYVKLF